MEDFQSQIEEAIRRRILDEISASRQAQIINNVYGSSAGDGVGAYGNAGRTVREAMAEFDPKDYNYFVDITREDVLGPEGEKMGWKKRVKRYADPKEKMIEELFGE